MDFSSGTPESQKTQSRWFLTHEPHPEQREDSEDKPFDADELGFETVPDQSTMWRARHYRFSDEFLQSITECVRSIEVLVRENGVSVPASSPSSLTTHPF